MRTLSITVASIFAAGLALAAGGASAQGPIVTSGGPQVGFRGCTAYEHASFGGDRLVIQGGHRRTYVGDRWNDRISSIACNRSEFCRLVVYEHRDYRGATRIFSNVRYVGDWWNDRISSMTARCGDSKDRGGE